MRYGKSQEAIDRLTAEQRRVTQEAGTERSFTGEYNDHALFGVQRASYVIGVIELSTAAALILRAFQPIFSALGARCPPRPIANVLPGHAWRSRSDGGRISGDLGSTGAVPS
jgi:hypothetical protein